MRRLLAFVLLASAAAVASGCSGVDAQKANWSEQAAKKAAEYLETSSFSRSGLIAQLKFEGFTTAQATYGVKKAGL